MTYTTFSYEVTLPNPSDDRAEYKIWKNRKMEMIDWCSQEIVNNWAQRGNTFYFLVKNDMNRFTDHFEIEEMNEIIEDTISRNRKFQEERRRKVERLKELKAPPFLIEYEEMISKMTLGEYKVHCDEMKKEDELFNMEYAKHNPIQKHIVDEIYSRVEKLEYEFLTYSSNVRFLYAIDPLNFMSKDDFNHDLYQVFLDHAKEIYREKYLNEYNQHIEDEDDED